MVTKEEGRDPASRRAIGCGCAAALVIGIPLLFTVFMMTSECGVQCYEDCRRDQEHTCESKCGQFSRACISDCMFRQVAVCTGLERCD